VVLGYRFIDRNSPFDGMTMSERKSELDFWIQWKEIVEHITSQWPPGEIRAGLRLGQVLFNQLYNENTAVANEIRGTEFDPFYQDVRIDSFLERVDQVWEKYL
jgi:hypothetical protein